MDNNIIIVNTNNILYTVLYSYVLIPWHCGMVGRSRYVYLGMGQPPSDCSPVCSRPLFPMVIMWPDLPEGKADHISSQSQLKY